MILSLAQWAQGTAFFTALRSSWYVYPVVLSLHLLGITIFGGMILATNMRLLGLAFRDRPISDMIEQLRIPKRFGLVLIATCGVLLLGAKAEEYYYNIFFRLKLVILGLIFVHGWIFRGSVYYNASELDRANPQIPGRARLAASLSILLWVGMACAGRGIGYIDPPLDKIHARKVAGPGATMRASAKSPRDRKNAFTDVRGADAQICRETPPGVDSRKGCLTAHFGS